MSSESAGLFNRNDSLTSGLVELVSAKPIAEADLRWTAPFTLDAIANIVGGGADPRAQPLLNWARAEPINTARIAFVYGGLATVLELDAMHRESAVHAGTVVVPAVLAIARGRRFGGRRLLEAILRGSEVAFRVGRAAGPGHYRIYQNTATCGPYGSAFAAGFLFGLDKSRLVHALGNAGTQSSGLWEYRETGAMTQQLHAGRAAESGLIAAQLAVGGFSGPLKIIEGARGFFKAACPDANPSAVLRGADDAWGLTGMSIKPWPSSHLRTLPLNRRWARRGSSMAAVCPMLTLKPIRLPWIFAAMAASLTRIGASRPSNIVLPRRFWMAKCRTLPIRTSLARATSGWRSAYRSRPRTRTPHRIRRRGEHGSQWN